MPDAITSGPSHRRSARGMIGVNTPGRTRWMTPDTANGTITIQGTVAAGFFARRVIPPFSPAPRRPGPPRGASGCGGWGAPERDRREARRREGRETRDTPGMPLGFARSRGTA